MLNSSEYEYMDEASIDSELICIICNKPLEDPQCTPCDHIFCKGCITEWIERNNASCPTCRQSVQTQKLMQANRIVRNILGKLRVKCVTCGKTDLERSDLEIHVTTACPTVCLAADMKCPWTGPRGQLDSHVANCHYQTLRPVLIPFMGQGKQLIELIAQQVTEAEKYKNEIGQLKQQMAQQQNHNQNNSRYINARELQLKSTIDQYLEQLRQFEDQLNHEKDQKNKHYNDFRQLKEQMTQQQTHYQNDIRHAIEQEAQQRTEIDRFQSKLQQLEEKLKQEKYQNNEQYNEIRQLKYQTKQQIAQVDNFKNEVRDLTEQLKRHSNRSDANEKHKRSLEEAIKQQKTVVTGYQNETIWLSEQLKQQRVETEEYQTEIKNLKKQIKDQPVQNQNEIRQLKEAAMYHKADIANYRSKIQQLQQQVDNQNIQISELQAEHHREIDESKFNVPQQNEQLMSQPDAESEQNYSVWSRLSNSGDTISSNRKVHRHETKRLIKRRFQYRSNDS